MATNKLALLRYTTIDKCLQNRQRLWTLEDIIEKVDEALYNYEGIETGISKRTLQLDLQNMRSDKLSYNAPIVVNNKKYYSYTDPNYSIHKKNLSTDELVVLNNSLQIIKQLSAFSQLNHLSASITKLESNVLFATQQSHNYIQLESNNLLKGLHFVQPLYDCIAQQQVVNITYQSFKAKQASEQAFYPYCLKEYRNRWFLLCKSALKKMPLTLLALDRIEQLEPNLKLKFQPLKNIDIDTYFDDCIGVTRAENSRKIRVALELSAGLLPYVLTKPLHHSQQLLKTNTNKSAILSIQVIHNFELERELLGFGDEIKVLGPRILQKRIAKILGTAAEQYKKD
jgi:predicted DNA-binding transcriptional regulator YafY